MHSFFGYSTPEFTKIAEAYNILAHKIFESEDIDKMILSKLKNWTIDRIFKIDLAILRLAIYEIMYFEDMPVKVAANEAVELAKKYGNDSSQNFVNGVIREVIKEKEN